MTNLAPIERTPIINYQSEQFQGETLAYDRTGPLHASIIVQLSPDGQIHDASMLAVLARSFKNKHHCLMWSEAHLAVGGWFKSAIPPDSYEETAVATNALEATQIMLQDVARVFSGKVVCDRMVITLFPAAEQYGHDFFAPEAA